MTKKSEKKFSIALNKGKGHATFTKKPTKKLLAAINKMAELAYKNIKS